MEKCWAANRTMKKTIISLLCSEQSWRNFLSLLLAIIFIVSGLSKLADVHSFAEDIIHFKIISVDWSSIIANCLPYLEIMIGLAIFFQPTRLSASFIMFGLMIIFTIVIASALARGLDVSCGCFGKAFEDYAGSGLRALLRDLVLLIISSRLFMLIWKKEVEVTSR